MKHKNCNCKTCKHEIVKKTFDESGCKLLSDISLSKKMEYICVCGEKSFTKWFNFKHGERCKKCAIIKTKQKNSKRLRVQNTIHDYFIRHNCELLEENYVNQVTKMKYICECGTEDFITWKSFQRGVRCHICAKNKVNNRFIPSGESHFKWNPNREEVELNKSVRARAKRMLKRTLLNQMKSDTTFKLLGYTKEELIFHIINHENWERVKNDDWELDHYFPIKAFCDYEIYDVKKINALENLRPIEKNENRIKNDSYNKTEFEKWRNEKCQ